jgi:hypothetical protein
MASPMTWSCCSAGELHAVGRQQMPCSYLSEHAAVCLLAWHRPHFTWPNAAKRPIAYAALLPTARCVKLMQHRRAMLQGQPHRHTRRHQCGRSAESRSAAGTQARGAHSSTDPVTARGSFACGLSYCVVCKESPAAATMTASDAQDYDHCRLPSTAAMRLWCWACV